MKVRGLLWRISSFALAALALVACKEEEENTGAPNVEISKSTLKFEDKASASQTIQLTATRDWVAKTDAEWIAIDPASGKGSASAVDVKITVLENAGLDRSATVTFDIGFASKTLTVEQVGSGSASDAIVYKNNFDKEEATKKFGENDSSWPYLDQFDGWKNAEGSGVGSETYDFKRMSVRANSKSNGSEYSDYEGSGSNNLFFGSSAYFRVSGIALPAEGSNFSLTFGSEKYLQEGDSKFNHDEFHVYISNDGSKWVELEYAFPNGDKEGRWDLATSTFTLPEGTTSLSVHVTADAASAYRLDDLNLSVSSEAGTAIDFSKGIEIAIGGGSTGGDWTDLPGATGEGTETSPYNVAKALNLVHSANVPTAEVYVKGIISSLGEFNDQFGNYTYNISDDGKTTNEFTIYRGKYIGGEKFTSEDQLSVGKTVVVKGTIVLYKGDTPEMNANNELISIDGQGGGTVEPVSGSIADVIAAEKGAECSTEGVVAGIYKKGCVITDGKDYLLCYNANSNFIAPDVKIGDNIQVSGTRTSYDPLPQLAFTYDNIKTVSSGNSVTYPTPVKVDASNISSFDKTKATWFEFTGVLSISGNYYNVKIDGTTTQGSLSYPLDDFNLSQYEGQSVTYRGFFAGGSNSKYLNMMLVQIEQGTGSYFGVSKTAISANADATSATFNVTGNVDWTVTSSDAAYTVSPASGNGASEVTVSFAANTTEQDKTVKLTVSTTAEVTTKTYEVTLTHKGVSAAGEEDYSSNVTWTLGDYAYDNTSTNNKQTATINGVEVDNLIKLGTSKKQGTVTITVPAGTKTFSFYAVAWKGETKGKLTANLGEGTTPVTFDVKSNDGATGTPPYTITVESSDKYSVDVTALTGGSPLPADVKVTVSFTGSKNRVLLFGIQAHK